ncbi:MAG: enoyl-CoA hydratase-related protein [Chloroflexia bacterium]
MMHHQFEHLKVWNDSGVTHVRLDRPDVHNAFNRKLIEELHHAFQAIEGQTPGTVRAVVLSGSGRSFCAGADINWMRESLNFTREENIADATRMAEMFAIIDRCPAPVVCRVHGAALGGGAGLTAVSDIVIAEDGARFAFSEAKLGIAPAVISPFVLRKIGQSHARSLFLTAERFDAARAMQIGLVHRVVALDMLGEEVGRVVKEILSSSPLAITRAKQLIARVPSLSPEDARQTTTEAIAELRTSTEGQEGLRAFLEKRQPEWSI